ADLAGVRPAADGGLVHAEDLAGPREVDPTRVAGVCRCAAAVPLPRHDSPFDPQTLALDAASAETRKSLTETRGFRDSIWGQREAQTRRGTRRAGATSRARCARSAPVHPSGGP